MHKEKDVFELIESAKDMLDSLVVDLEDQGMNALAIIADAHDLIERITSRLLWEEKPPKFRMRKSPV